MDTFKESKYAAFFFKKLIYLTIIFAGKIRSITELPVKEPIRNFVVAKAAKTIKQCLKTKVRKDC